MVLALHALWALFVDHVNEWFSIITRRKTISDAVSPH